MFTFFWNSEYDKSKDYSQEIYVDQPVMKTPSITSDQGYRSNHSIRKSYHISTDLSQIEKQSVAPPVNNVNIVFNVLYRLAGLWFVTVAAGSVICSIPISAMGLPIILGIGITCLVIVAICQWIVLFWIKLLGFWWKAILAMIMSPRYLFSFGISLLRKIGHAVVNYNNPPTEQLLPMNEYHPPSRKFSTSRLTDRSLEDQRRRYYEPMFTRPNHSCDTNQSPKLTQSFDYLESIDLPIRSTQLNPQFLWLTPEHGDRLDYCRQLYSSSTNLPLDHFDLSLGTLEDGTIHYILSLWNEPDINDPLDYTHLIGFCQYFVYKERPNAIHIDKLNVSSEYSENGIVCIKIGFSKRIIRKLMHTSNVLSIQVWSVWRAESFYKALGFKNVLEQSESHKKPKRVEGEWGPLLMWSMEIKRDQCSRYDHSSQALRSQESTHNHSLDLANLKTEEKYRLQSKGSMISLLGGHGAYSLQKEQPKEL